MAYHPRRTSEAPCSFLGNALSCGCREPVEASPPPGENALGILIGRADTGVKQRSACYYRTLLQCTSQLNEQSACSVGGISIQSHSHLRRPEKRQRLVLPLRASRRFDVFLTSGVCSALKRDIQSRGSQEAEVLPQNLQSSTHQSSFRAWSTSEPLLHKYPGQVRRLSTSVRPLLAKFWRAVRQRSLPARIAT